MSCVELRRCGATRILPSRRATSARTDDLITNRPLKCVGYSREARSRSARQSDLIWARSDQGRQRLAQTRGNGEEGRIINDVRANFCSDG